jgi:hypothetical protein
MAKWYYMGTEGYNDQANKLANHLMKECGVKIKEI